MFDFIQFDAAFWSFVVAITLLTVTPGVDTLLVIRNTSRGGLRDWRGRFARRQPARRTCRRARARARAAPREVPPAHSAGPESRLIG